MKVTEASSAHMPMNFMAASSGQIDRKKECAYDSDGEKKGNRAGLWDNLFSENILIFLHILISKIHLPGISSEHIMHSEKIHLFQYHSALVKCRFRSAYPQLHAVDIKF